MTKGGRLSGTNYADALQKSNNSWEQTGNRVLALADAEREKGQADTVEEFAGNQTSGDRSEAAKIYEAATAGKANPANSIRQVSKVPYGYLAKDGVINYNGITFVCDERTNSICLGDVEDKSQVITVALSGGGYLKVNRANIGDLAKAAGMFSPEDLNRIMRAIAKDTKVQSMKQEIDDMENSVGNEIKPDSDSNGSSEEDD